MPKSKESKGISGAIMDAVNASNKKKGAATAAAGGQSELDKLIASTQQDGERNRNYLDSYVRPEVDSLKEAGVAANRGDQFTNLARYNTTAGTAGKLDTLMGDMAGSYNTYAGQGQGLAGQNVAALAKYTGQNAGLIDQLKDINWQDAQSAGEGLDAQRSALQQYGALTTPQITAQERFLSKKSQMEREQQERAARDASMTDLSARGMRGSGAELTNMLNAQQLGGQNRVLADLGAQANAVDRSMTALQGYANTGNAMRGNDDIIAMFNSGQGQLAKEWKAEQEAKLAKEGVDTTTAANEKTDTINKNVLTASQDEQGGRYKVLGTQDSLWDRYFGNQDAAVDRAYGRTKNNTGASFDLANLYTGGQRQDSAALADLIKAKVGDQSARDAADAVKPKKSIWDSVPFL